MSKESEYQNHATSIGKIYTTLGTQLSEADVSWLSDIFTVTAGIDELIDTSHDIELPGKIVRTLLGEENPELGGVTNLRKSLLSHKNGEERLIQFVRKIKLLFRCTQELSKITQPSKYFKYSIIEGRLFGEMVALGVTDLHLQKLIGRAGGMENLTDDILDGKQDSKNGERQISPDGKFYMQGVSTTIFEIINLGKTFGLKTAMKSVRASLPTMWKKYIMDNFLRGK